MIMAENKQQHTTSPVSCLHGQMYHHANSISSLAATSAPGYPLSTLSPNVIANPKQHPTHSVIPVVQPAVVAQIDPRVIVEHRDGQFVTIPTIELQPIPQTDINEKIAIYRHPLFPLLRILFEKCELSTSYVDLINGGTFDTEIKEFITQMARENKPFFTDDADVDNLMLKSLQVLRIHLLELEKVNELCKDFCTRYISCLKGKLNSENIMKTLDIGSSSTSPIQSPSQTTSQNSTPDSPTAVDNDDIPSNTERSASQLSESKSSSEDVDLLPQSSTSASSENMTNDQDDRTVATNLHIQRLTSGFLSKKNKGTKRGVLPKSATTVLKGWLFQHLVHPYPTEDEKRELALQTNLSNLQVNNWFINARRRILQPMLESSNSFLKTNKKSKQQRNAAQKDWTNTIGVYNAYRTEALQSTASDSNGIANGLVGSVAWVPSNSPMLVTLPNRTATHSVQGQPIHFLQMPQIPIQTGSSTYLPTAANPTSPNQVLTSCQQTITLPIYSQTVPVSQAKHNSNVAG